MKVYKCDRCGKIQEGPLWQVINTIDQHSNRILEQYELCDECFRDFQTWIKGDSKANNCNLGDSLSDYNPGNSLSGKDILYESTAKNNW